MKAINSFLKSIGLDKIKLNLGATQDRLLPPGEDWYRIGSLLPDERILYATQMWCMDKCEEAADYSGKPEYSAPGSQEFLDNRCEKMNNIAVKMMILGNMCGDYLELALHERLKVRADVLLAVRKKFDVYQQYDQDGDDDVKEGPNETSSVFISISMVN